MSEDQVSKQESAVEGSNRRTVKGLLVKPRQQMKYSFMFIGGGMLVLTLFIGVVIYALNTTMISLEAGYGLDPEISQALRNSFTSTLSIALLLSAVLSLFAFLLGIQLSHRIYGPMIPLQRHILELKNGNYTSRVKLRKNDELTELQDSLNDLAATLEARARKG